MKRIVRLFFLLIFTTIYSQKLPENFVYLKSIAPTIQTELRYFTHHNFVGKPIDGYKKDVVIISLPAAKALLKVQNLLDPFELSLKIYDAYRPQRAVNHFVRWAKVLNDTVMKHEFYPTVAKKELFKRGYIAAKSGHTRGSTVDLTIVDKKTGKVLDMGSPYDFFGIPSHVIYSKITAKQRANRLLLRNLMLTNGFNPYVNEWWHFTLKNEPFPNTYFNFPIQ